MQKLALLTVAASIALVSSAMADTPAMTDRPTKTIKPATMSCDEFLAVDEVTRPSVVFWAEGLNSKGKPDAVFDVERTNRLVPVLVEDCKKEPKTSFWTKMKMELKKVF